MRMMLVPAIYLCTRTRLGASLAVGREVLCISLIVGMSRRASLSLFEIC